MRQHLIAWMPPPGVGVHPCTPQSRFPGHPNVGSRLVATATLRNRTHTTDLSFHPSPPAVAAGRDPTTTNPPPKSIGLMLVHRASPIMHRAS